MAQSLLPWMNNYFISIAEEHGASLLSVPLFEKSKKAQITEFLTYPSGDEHTAIWARISDKQTVIPIKFTKEAVQEYSMLSGKRLTELKSAVIAIKGFKPFFSRIPLGNQRMTAKSCLAIECSSFSVIGSIGEAMFGNPKPVEANPDLKLWTEGLRQHGGAGNVLKERKAERQKAAGPSDAAAKKAEPVERQQAGSSNAVAKEPTAVKRQGSGPKTVAKSIPNGENTVPEKENRKELTASRILKLEELIKYPRFRKPPADVAAILAAMRVYGESDNDEKDALENSPPRKRQRTGSPTESRHTSLPPSSSPERPISDWAPTPTNIRSPIDRSKSPANAPTPARRTPSPICRTPSPVRRTAFSSPAKLSPAPPVRSSPMQVSSPVAPGRSSPARASSPTSPVRREASIALAPSSPVVDTSAKYPAIPQSTMSSHPPMPTPAQRPKPVMLPPSSPAPPSSSMIASETIFPSQSPTQNVDMPSHPRRAVKRKVPRPRSPRLSNKPDGPIRILAPNSDTSISYSQSQSQSQSQPKSQTRSSLSQALNGSQPLHESRSVNGSQLVNDSQPRKDSQMKKSSQLVKGAQSVSGAQHENKPAGKEPPSVRELPVVSEAPPAEMQYDGDASSPENMRVKKGKQTRAGSAGGKRQSALAGLSDTEPEGDNVSKGLAGGIIEHDREAWKGPSFAAKRAAKRVRKLAGYSVSMYDMKRTEGTMGWGELHEILCKVEAERGNGEISIVAHLPISTIVRSPPRPVRSSLYSYSPSPPSGRSKASHPALNTHATPTPLLAKRFWTHALFLIMSISFAGFGLMTLRNPFADLVSAVVGKGDLRSMFCLVVFCIVFLVLAYLTNPSENSFRAYLIEQSFRQHLSRLDDPADEDQHTPGSKPPSTRVPPAPGPAHTRSFDNSSPFHFANRASVSLRTPKHVFHSFAVFTIAAMVPMSKSAPGEDRDGWIISDSWYIGAFGRWWRGGVLEAWYQDVISRSKDEESWSSGILCMKSMDMLQDCNGPTFSAKSLPPHLLPRGSPPRLRNRERSSQRPSALSARSLTPPPLPKSVSLPLHATRPPVLSVDRSSSHRQPVPQSQPILPTDSTRHGSSLPSRSPSAIFDQSPLIAEVLHQISTSKASVLELRAQLTECQSAASQSHALLQEEVDSYREKKRQEDASKLELKSRTKALDDSKRSAESTKKEAEKKLKVAQNARDGANRRIELLDQEILQLQQRLRDDEAFVHESQVTISEPEQEVTDALEQKRQEIKVAEDLVAALNQRSRELEEKLTDDKERLRLLRERADERKHALSPQRTDAASQPVPSEVWPSASYGLSRHSPNGSTYSAHATAERERRESLPDLAAPKPDNLTLGNISSFNTTTTAIPNGNLAQSALPANSYPIFGDRVQNYSHAPAYTVGAPLTFGDSDAALTRRLPVLTPTSQSLIPTGLMTSFDSTDSLSRSFQSESDAFMDREWRGNGLHSHSQHADSFTTGYTTMTTSSPTSLHGPSASDLDHDPFEVRTLPRDYRWEHMNPVNSMDVQRAPWIHRTQSDPRPVLFDPEEGDSAAQGLFKTGPRRWFSTKDKPKKGLNPDAKEFSLSKKSGTVPNIVTTHVSHSSYDALNPNGLGSTAMSSAASTNSSLLRAFAPSPAEREALQRALGGSTNTSFERLPSLSDVGSIPSSPSHVHAIPHVPQHSARELGKVLPSWLQSLPRIRKVNFSPWDDEEPTNSVDDDSGKALKG